LGSSKRLSPFSRSRANASVFHRKGDPTTPRVASQNIPAEMPCERARDTWVANLIRSLKSVGVLKTPRRFHRCSNPLRYLPPSSGGCVLENPTGFNRLYRVVYPGCARSLRPAISGGWVMFVGGEPLGCVITLQGEIGSLSSWGRVTRTAPVIK